MDSGEETTRLRYAQLLHEVVFAEDPLLAEAALAAAADLGREWVRQGVPPEEVADIHAEALLDLAQAHPELRFGDVAGQLTAPLMEAYMAYSLAFRQQLEKRAEALVNARLEQSRRLEAIGTLAAGIAHDFNNLLGSMLGFNELLQDDVPPGSRGEKYCQHIALAGGRARDLVQRMLAFARDLSDDPVPVELNTAIHEAMALLRASLPPKINLGFASTVTAAWVLAEPSEIQQIIVNLAVNAADAIGEQNGRVTLALERGAAGFTLTVADDGEGMATATLQRVFDPFFTTKEPGKGSGLGLSVVHGLVTKLGGDIAVSSLLGQGTTFSIHLPELVQDDS